MYRTFSDHSHMRRYTGFTGLHESIATQKTVREACFCNERSIALEGFTKKKRAAVAVRLYYCVTCGNDLPKQTWQDTRAFDANGFQRVRIQSKRL